MLAPLAKAMETERMGLTNVVLQRAASIVAGKSAAIPLPAQAVGTLSVKLPKQTKIAQVTVPGIFPSTTTFPQVALGLRLQATRIWRDPCVR